MAEYFLKKGNEIVVLINVDKNGVSVVKWYNYSSNVNELVQEIIEEINKTGVRCHKRKIENILQNDVDLLDVLVTYEQVLKFYLRKSSMCSDKLKRYIDLNSKKDEEYIKLAHNFNLYKRLDQQDRNDLEEKLGKMLNCKIDKSDKSKYCNLYYHNGPRELELYDNVQYYFVLNNYRNNYKVNEFVKILKADDYMIDYEIDKETVKFNQKWHLIISYIMYQLLYNLQDSQIKWGDNGSMQKSTLNAEFKYYYKAKCPELMLWMIEASGIVGHINELDDQYIELITDIAKMKKNNEKTLEIKAKYPWADIAKLIIEKYPSTKDNEDK